MKFGLPPYILNSAKALPCAILLLATTTSPSFADPITVTSEIIENFHIGSSNPKAGKLTFLGGLELESPNRDFGGFSGLRLDPNSGRIYSASDNGFWLTAKLMRDDKGKLKGLAQSDLSCVCRRNGKPYGSKHWGDAEAVEIRGNKAYIGFERLNRINGYDLGKDHRLGPPSQVTTSFKPAKIDYNKGLEAIALAPAGSRLTGKFIAIAEESLNRAGQNRAFIADAKNLQEFAIARTDDFSVTDASFLPDGDLVIMERKFSFSAGVAIRIRKLATDKIKPGAILTGTVLMEAGLTSRIDNMEGITAWRDEEGKTRIAIISDDNYSRIQRTLLLEFRLDE